MALTCKLELARFSTSLRFQDRAGSCKGTELNGGTQHILIDGGNNLGGEKHKLGWGDTAHTFMTGGTIEGDTSHE